MVTSCDSQPGAEVVEDCERSGLGLERSPVCGDHPVDGNAHNQGHVQPVDMLVPIGLGDGLLGDVRLLGIIFLVSIGLSGLRHACCLSSHGEELRERRREGGRMVVYRR